VSNKRKHSSSSSSSSSSHKRKHKKSSTHRKNKNPYVDITKYYKYDKDDCHPHIVRAGPVVVKPVERTIDYVTDIRIFGLYSP
jgi:hypothetical protein